MKAAPFALAFPDSVDEAIGALSLAAGDARVLAGGQSLMPLLVMRLTSPAVLVDLARVGELDHIELTEAGADGTDGAVVIGAMTRQRTVECNSEIGTRVGLLRDALPQIAHVTIRNQGTVGGSIAHADPTSELPTVALATNATMVVRGPDGHRSIAAADFFLGPHRTAMSGEELLIAVRFPGDPAGAGTAFEEVGRRRGDVAIVGVAALIHLDQAGVIDDVRIAISSVGPTPVRIVAAESMLIGAPPSIEAFAACAAMIENTIDPPSDLNGTAAFRCHLAGVLVRRALTLAAGRTR